MERSNYQDFMDCLKPWETLSRAIISGVVLWEMMQHCEAHGIPYTEIDIDMAAREVERRYALMCGGLYALAMQEWAESYYSRQTMEKDEAAADNGGCNSVCNNNSS